MKRFRIGGDGPVYDCRVDQDAVTCTVAWDKPPAPMTSFDGEVTGTLSGVTLTGMSRIHQSSWDQMDPQCAFDEDVAGPITYTFGRDGTVTMRDGPAAWRRTNRGSCPGSLSGTYAVVQYGLPWSKVE